MFFGASFAAIEQMSARTWSDASGKFSIEAEFVDLIGDEVLLKKADGSAITVAVSRLSLADRRYIESIGPQDADHAQLAADPQISALLAKVAQQSDMPAMAGAIVTGNGLVAFGVAGVRKRGTDSPAMPNDLWHLGSNTKAMTATLVARLVEQEKLKWDTTLGEVFPGGNSKIHPGFRDVTVLQLLSHRAGLQANLKLSDYLGAKESQQRLRAVRQELTKPPQAEPGSKYQYSNLGYIIVGAMIEKATGKPWQTNMKAEVFGPLKMKSAGFGGTGTIGKVDQPWGHTDDGRPVSQNGPSVDNPPVMGPAGRVHCTIQDWAKYVADFLRGMRGEQALLPAVAYKKLSTPPFGGDYALGWIVTQREWAGGIALTHSGSNTMNYATVWMAPQRDFAILVCTNQGGDAASKACDAAVVALLDHHRATADREAAGR